MRIQRTLGRFPSPTPCWFLVRMYLCGYVACSARAPAQHCWMCCANERNIVGPRFDDRETIEMLALVGSEVWPVSNFIQQLPTSRNNTQHGVQTLATCWAQQCCVLLANNVASVCTGLNLRRTPKFWQKKTTQLKQLVRDAAINYIAKAVFIIE